MKPPYQLLAVCVLSVVSGFTAAHAETGGIDGFASVGMGQGNSKYGSFDDGGLAREAQFSVAYTDKSGFGGQLDGGYFKQNYEDYKFNAGLKDVTEHLYYRNSGWLVGAFAQQRKYFVNGEKLNVKSQFWGVEGQAYLNDMTIYGQLGKSQWKYVGGSTSPDKLATLELRYFVNDNLRMDGSINYMKEDFGSGSWNQKTYGAGFEYRLQNNPLSMFVRYEYAQEETSSGFETDNRRFLLGVKFNFGKDSLRKSDREGASLKPVTKDQFFGIT